VEARGSLRPPTRGLTNEDLPAQLLLNKGDGTFKDISSSARIDRIAYSKGVAVADYDNDGWPDLFVSNLHGPNFLYHNNHDNAFTEMGLQAGVQSTTCGFATWFFDYDQ
jgi:enediyne biosynthesis protein E4